MILAGISYDRTATRLGPFQIPPSLQPRVNGDQVLNKDNVLSVHYFDITIQPLVIFFWAYGTPTGRIIDPHPCIVFDKLMRCISTDPIHTLPAAWAFQDTKVISRDLPNRAQQAIKRDQRPGVVHCRKHTNPKG